MKYLQAYESKPELRTPKNLKKYKWFQKHTDSIKKKNPDFVKWPEEGDIFKIVCDSEEIITEILEYDANATQDDFMNILVKDLFVKTNGIWCSEDLEPYWMSLGYIGKEAILNEEEMKMVEVRKNAEKFGL
jgi:hypothetical protein